MGYKTSIVIPYKTKYKSLSKLIEVLVSQSSFLEFEIFIVCGRLPTHSRKIIEKIAAKYHNINAVESRCDELSNLYNRGLDLASAPYVIFLNPGDEVIGDGYSLLTDEVYRLGSEMLIASGEIVDDLGLTVATDEVGSFTYENLASGKVKKSLLVARVLGPRVIYSTEFLKANNIMFQGNYATKEREVFEMISVAHAQKISKINNIVCRYHAQEPRTTLDDCVLEAFNHASDTLYALYQVYLSISNDAVAMNRLIEVICDDYVAKLISLDDYNDAMNACAMIGSACEKLGYDRFFRTLVLRKQLKLIEAMQQRDYSYLMFLSAQLQLKEERSARLKAVKTAKKQTGKLKKIQKRNEELQNRNPKNSSVLDALFNRVPVNWLPKSVSDADQSDEMLRQLLLTDSSSNGYWVFQDRFSRAQDNAEALYRHVMKNEIYDKTAFVLEEDSSCYQRLKAEGFNLISAYTIEHWKILRNCKYFITSHCDDFAQYPWIVGQEDKFEINAKVNPLYKLIFLQHGVIRSDLSNWLGKKDFHKFITSSRYERDSLLAIPQYKLIEEEVILTGQARFDYLCDTSTESIITVFPTWRREMRRAARRSFNRRREWFSKSPYCNSWIGLLKREDLLHLASQHELKIRLVMHYNVNPFVDLFKEVLPDAIEVIPYDEVESFAEIVNSSKMLITDKSSFSFDFLYLDKPVIYYDFDKGIEEENLLQIDYSSLGYYCQNEDGAIENILNCTKRNFALDSSKAKNIVDFFAFRDRNNSYRIVQEILRSEAGRDYD